MRKRVTRMGTGLIVALIALLPLTPAFGQTFSLPSACEEFAFSTEEDFKTLGPVPTDGNPIISDGDLLGANCTLCARNGDLVGTFDVNVDLGLDAADVIDARSGLVAFSTELNSPNRGQFTQGDLLVTNGVIITNTHLTHLFNVGYDIGLDAVHFLGQPEAIIAFLGELDGNGVPGANEFIDVLGRYGLDIWFSTEGTCPTVERPCFLDGDLLSAGTGTIVADNATLLPASVPAGIPNRGVDFGLDAATSNRIGRLDQIRFSTEILHRDTFSFTDGDGLRYGNGVVMKHGDLIACFEPKADFLGLDALHMAISNAARLVHLPVVLAGFEQTD